MNNDKISGVLAVIILGCGAALLMALTAKAILWLF